MCAATSQLHKKWQTMNYTKTLDLLQGVNDYTLYQRLDKGNTLGISYKDESLAVRYYWTDVITWKPDRRIILNSGGWRTYTTKDRINHYLQYPPWKTGWFSKPVDCYISQKNSQWYIERENYREGNYEKPLFYDGVVLNSKGTILKPKQIDRKTKTTLRLIEKYIRKLSHCIRNEQLLHNYLSNTSGDCWYCLFHEKDSGRPWGNAIGNQEHLTSHIKEGYIMGSLIYNALMYSGYRESQLPFLAIDFWYFKQIIIRSVRKYLKGELLGINRKSL